jgi:hypothetical protein
MFEQDLETAKAAASLPPSKWGRCGLVAPWLQRFDLRDAFRQNVSVQYPREGQNTSWFCRGGAGYFDGDLGES